MSVGIYVTKENKSMVQMILFLSETESDIIDISKFIYRAMVKTLGGDNCEIWFPAFLKTDPLLESHITKDTFFTFRTANIPVTIDEDKPPIIELPLETFRAIQNFLVEGTELSTIYDTFKGRRVTDGEQFVLKGLIDLKGVKDFINLN